MHPERVHRRRRLGTLAIAAAVGISMISTASLFRGDLQNAVARIDPQGLLLAGALALGYRLLNAFNWGLVLRGLGARLGAWPTASIWLTSEACRWLPGSLWSYGSRGAQAAAAGISSPVAAMSLGLEMLLTIAAWFATAAIFLAPHAGGLTPVLPADGLWRSDQIVVLLLLLPIGGWFLVRIACSVLPHIVQRWPQLRQTRLEMRGILLAGINYLVLCVLNGLTLYVVVRSLRPESGVAVSAVIGANAAAWLIGYFAFVAPGGLLVREGALAAMLGCWMPAELAITAAVLWRALQLGVELLLLAGLLLPQIVSEIRVRLAVDPMPRPDLKFNSTLPADIL